MRTVFLVLVLGGCVADADDPPPITTTPQPNVTLVDSRDSDGATELDVCALAAELPIDDICSLICDPPAMAARMVDDGNDTGTCYQLYCSLPGDAYVLVGVCLPP